MPVRAIIPIIPERSAFGDDAYDCPSCSDNSSSRPAARAPDFPPVAKKKLRFKSCHFEAIWETASGLRACGLLTDAELAVYADASLTNSRPSADPRTSPSAP